MFSNSKTKLGCITVELIKCIVDIKQFEERNFLQKLQSDCLKIFIQDAGQLFHLNFGKKINVLKNHRAKDENTKNTNVTNVSK